MNKIIIAVGALATLGLAAPAAAQSNWNGDAYHGYSQGNRGTGVRIDQLRQRVAYDAQRRIISQRTAYRFSDQLRQLSILERQYSRGGTSWAERRSLQQRVDYLQRQLVAVEQRGRGDTFDRGERYGRDGESDRYRGNDGNYRDGYDRNDDRRTDRNESDSYDGRDDRN